MRLEARVLEGDEVRTALVPLATFHEFRTERKQSINQVIARDATAVAEGSDADFSDWQPWVVWHALTWHGQESREFGEWFNAVEWVGIFEAPDALDPSGGEESQTLPSSPASSSDAVAPTAGRGSSASTKSSRQRSGTKSTARARS